MTDEELARRVAEGEIAALQHLLDRYYGPLFRYLWHAGGSKEDAEDLASQTLLRVRREITGFRGLGTLDGWIFRVAYRELLRYRRRQLVARIYRPSPKREPDPEDSIVLTAALAALPLNQRMAFLLMEVEGLTVQEAALALSVPPGTVKSRCYHARLALRKLLGTTYGEAHAEPAPE